MTDYSDLTYSLAGVRRTNPYDRRRVFAQQLQRAGTDFSPVDHPLQGAARLAQALVGGWMSGRADQDEAEAVKKRESSLAAAMAETDPKKRIAMLSASDPDLGARLSGQLAVEEAKQAKQREGLGVVADGYGPPPSSASPPGAPTQLGVNQGAAPPGGNAGFANNVGNIRATNINWQDKGQPHNGFETFGTPQAGANAMAKNLQAYVKAQPNMTVADAIKKWAPPNENNTAAYIRGLAESTGINPGMPLAQVLQDQALAATLMDGIGRIEKGGLPQGFTADTFMTAAAPGAPPQVAQGDNPGMPPSPSPQGVTGPTMVAQPTPPMRLTIEDAPREVIAPFVERLRRGGYGVGPDAEQKMRADIQGALDRNYENQKFEYDRAYRDFEYNRKRGDDRTSADQKRGDDLNKQKIDDENKLRDDFDKSPAVKAYRTVVPMLESAKDAAARPTRAADLNLVYAFAKLMDPDSVVRESETAGVVATGNLGDRLGAYVGQLNGQAMLSPETRAKLIAELDSRFTSLESQYKAHEAAYEGIARNRGLNFDNVRIPIGTRQQRDGLTPTQDELTRWSGTKSGPRRIDINGRPL